jgi:hypothetical protein
MKESLLYQPTAEPKRKAISNLERAYYEVSDEHQKKIIMMAINLIRKECYELRQHD